jgi:hypothetical protein
MYVLQYNHASGVMNVSGYEASKKLSRGNIGQFGPMKKNHLTLLMAIIKTENAVDHR